MCTRSGLGDVGLLGGWTLHVVRYIMISWENVLWPFGRNAASFVVLRL